MVKREEECTVCSGIQADVQTLKDSDRDQWTAINQLKNRLPTWATVCMTAGGTVGGAIIGVLSTLLAMAR